MRPVAGGSSKINPPNSHPSNPIHKQAMQAQGLGETKNVNKEKTCILPETHIQTTLVDQMASGDAEPETDKIEPHHVNRSSMIKGVLGQPNFSPQTNAIQKTQTFCSFFPENSNLFHSSNLTQPIYLC